VLATRNMLAKTSILLLVSFGAIDPNSLCVNAVNALPQSAPHKHLMRRQPEKNPLETKVDSLGLLVQELERVNVANTRPDDQDDTNVLEQAEDEKVRACQQDALGPGKQAARRRANKTCRQLSGRDFGAGTTSQIKDGKARNVCRANTIQGEAARKFCCKSCATAPMQAIFGGDERGADVNGKMVLPEEVRAQRCTGDKCEECSSSANCFHSSHGSTSNRWGAISELSVKAGLPFTSYRSSSYAKCETGDLTELSVIIKAMKNGHVKIFLNDIHKKTLMGDGGNVDTHGGGGGDATNMWHDKRGGGEAIQLSVEFFPNDPNQESSVTLHAEMDNVRPDFEQCMDHKTCLAKMGNMKSAASYALRNKNEYQLSCLKRTTLAPFLRTTCEAWRTCVHKNLRIEKILITALSAAISTSHLSPARAAKAAADAKTFRDDKAKAVADAKAAADAKAFRDATAKAAADTKAAADAKAATNAKATTPAHAQAKAVADTRPKAPAEAKVCNWACYLARYRDLRKRFGTNEKKAERHYKRHGKKEGRDCTCSKADYDKFESGACRGTSKSDNPSSWYTRPTFTGTLGDCEAKCTARPECKAIEYNTGSRSHCELWTKEPQHTSGGSGGTSGYACMKKKKAEATSFTQVTRQQDECFDPSTGDVEALECECMTKLQAKCGDDEECFVCNFCHFEGVCTEWKIANDCANECPEQLLQTETSEVAAAEAKRRSPKAYMALAAKRRSQQTENSSSANILTDNLEGALQGKCASQD